MAGIIYCLKVIALDFKGKFLLFPRWENGLFWAQNQHFLIFLITFNFSDDKHQRLDKSDSFGFLRKFILCLHCGKWVIFGAHN